MLQYQQVLMRLRAGDSVREIARSGLMGRDKLGELRAVAQQQGWLEGLPAAGLRRITPTSRLVGTL